MSVTEARPSQRKMMVAGNWKMHGTQAWVRAFSEGLSSRVAAVSQAASIDWVLFPPFVYVEQVARLLQGTGIAWGAQNVSAYEQGAYTGEVSVAMLRDLGCTYCLVGHSERRSAHGDTDALVAEKFMVVCQAGLIPVLCLGETQQERERGDTEMILDRQLSAVLSLCVGHSDNALGQAIIAYEPVWSIGTGLSAQPEQAQKAHHFIRARIAQEDSVIAQAIRILYGGSLKPGNAADLFAMPDVDGGLVGGASLDVEQFWSIGQSCWHC